MAEQKRRREEEERLKKASAANGNKEGRSQLRSSSSSGEHEGSLVSKVETDISENVHFTEAFFLPRWPASLSAAPPAC